MTKVAPSIVDMLSDAVKSRGMLRLLTHEVIGKGLFSTAWSSGVSPLEAWDEQLRNREDLELALQLFIRQLFGSFHVARSLFLLGSDYPKIGRRVSFLCTNNA